MKTLKRTPRTKLKPLSYSLYNNKLQKISNIIMPFEGLGTKELASYFDNIRTKNYPARSLVFMPEDYASESLYLLKQGLVELYRLTGNGKRLVTAQILPGEVFGVRGALAQTIQGNFAEAVEDSTVCIVTRKQLLTYLKLQPDILLKLLENACYALYLLEERFMVAIYSPILVRLAHLLLTSATPESGLLINATHEDIGNTIGAARQTVTKTLNLMQKRDFIRTKPKQIQIIDRRGLEEIVWGARKINTA